MNRAFKEVLWSCFLFAVPVAIGILLFLALPGCAAIAHGLGVATQGDLDQTTKTVHEVGDAFGPYGSLIATGISAALVVVNHLYRNSTRAKDIAEAVKPGV